MSPLRYTVVFGRRNLFTICHSQKVQHPGLEHPAGIGRASNPPQKAIVFPTYLNQFNQQLARSPVANFDAYDSHGMAAVTGRGLRRVQGSFPQSAAGQGFAPPSLVRRGIGSAGP